MTPRRPHAARRRAFSLVEILIVVMILGILAAIAVPKLTNASQVSRENSLKEDLRILRTALGVYKTQHPAYPGYPIGDTTRTPTAAIAHDQLLLYTDDLGNTSGTSSATYKWGPYMNDLPKNPLNNSSDLTILSDTDAFTADGTTGWLYQPSTGILKPNIAGDDSSGYAIIDY